LVTGLGLDQIYARKVGSSVQSYLGEDLSSTSALTSSSGGVQRRYVYEPFGFTTQSGPLLIQDTNQYRWLGREDEKVGLYYLRNRFYSPYLHRFVSRDPLGFGGGDANLYAYAANSPTNVSDRRGRAGVGDGYNIDPGVATGSCCPGDTLAELEAELERLQAEVKELRAQLESQGVGSGSGGRGDPAPPFPGLGFMPAVDIGNGVGTFAGQALPDINLVGGLGLSAIALSAGAEINFGAFLNLNRLDFGAFGSVGAPLVPGYNISVEGFVGVIVGSITGQTINVNVVVGIASISALFDLNTGQLIGILVGPGLAGPPIAVGGSVTFSQAGGVVLLSR
jgi:RHS repeat-associated protein